MIETLAMIDAPHFRAGIILQDDRVVTAANIVRYMAKHRWTRQHVDQYCEQKRWTVTVLHQVVAR